MQSKFKVGDKVRVIDNSGSPDSFKVGEIHIIRSIERVKFIYGNGDTFLIRVEGKKSSMYEHRFELVKENEMIFELKVGHIVKDRAGRTGIVLDGRHQGLSIGYFKQTTAGTTYCGSAALYDPKIFPADYRIVEVYDYKDGLPSDLGSQKLVWKYEEPKKSASEIALEVLEAQQKVIQEKMNDLRKEIEQEKQ